MSASHAPSAASWPPPRAGRARPLGWAGLALVVVGAGLSGLALLGGDGPKRLAYAYLLAFTFCWAIVLGSLFFVALQHITRSVWSVVLRRVAEMLAAPMWVLALLFAPLLVFALAHDTFALFPWLDRARDAAVEEKAPYLNLPFFVARTAVFFLIWVAFAAFFVRRSLRQDVGEGGAAATAGMQKAAAPFLLLFGLTLTFASFDWLMSLEPHWFSTIFGVYVFSGMTLASLAAITLAVLWLRARGWLGEGLVRPDHLYSLGTLLFAFTCFWGYIAFSQYMLIWYANIPEETVYFVHRWEHGWAPVSVLLAALRFAVPFLLLLSRPAKTDPRRLVAASVLVLAGQAVDLYWLVMPQVHASGPRVGLAEVGPLVLLAGVLALYLASFLGRHRAVAAGDPRFEASRDFHL